MSEEEKKGTKVKVKESWCLEQTDARKRGKNTKHHTCGSEIGAHIV